MGHKGSSFKVKQENHGGINPCWREPSSHIWSALREERLSRQAGTPRTNGANPQSATPAAVNHEAPAVSPSTQGPAAFIKACIQENNRQSFSGFHHAWQMIADGIMENALESKTLALALTTPTHDRTQTFTEALLESVLRVAIETDKPRFKPQAGMSHDFLLNRNPNGAELKPQVAENIRQFVKYCSKTYSVLLDSSPLNGKAAER